MNQVKPGVPTVPRLRSPPHREEKVEEESEEVEEESEEVEEVGIERENTDPPLLPASNIAAEGDDAVYTADSDSAFDNSNRRNQRYSLRPQPTPRQF